MLRRLANHKLSTLIIIFMSLSMQCYKCTTVHPLGSILFEDHGFVKKCFVQSDIALLATRYKFQELLPARIELMNDASVTAMIQYFYEINDIIDHMSGSNSKELVQKCFYDMLGSYLKHLILPITKFSFYAGNVTYSCAQNVFNLFERCKELLDTNGNEWADPITDFSQFTIKILPLVLPKVTDDESMKACANLALNQNDEDNEEDMLVALPKIETEENEDLSTIWLPLKRKHIFNINSKTSAFILFRFYVMVTQCYSYQGINQSVFNRKLKMWIGENVLPYLDNDRLYPAFGAILRIMESIKGSGDFTYRGRKERHRSNNMQAAHSNFFDVDEDAEEFSYTDTNRNFDWWTNAVFFTSAIFLILLLMICFTVKLCNNRKRIEQNEGVGKRKSLKDKIANVLRKNTHMPENDEFYPYKKVPAAKGKGIKFENEKSRKTSHMSLRKMKSKRTADKEKIKLPLLNNETESEDEIVLHKATPHTSTSSLNSKKKSPNESLFKISEDSDERGKKAQQKKSSTGQLFSKFRNRSKSPLRKNRDT